jgi:hypothetical protein
MASDGDNPTSTAAMPEIVAKEMMPGTMGSTARRPKRSWERRDEDTG